MTATTNKGQKTRKLRPFPSCLSPLFQNKSQCKTMHKKFSPTGSFSCKSNSFSYETFYAKTRFETEAQANLGIFTSYSLPDNSPLIQSRLFSHAGDPQPKVHCLLHKRMILMPLIKNMIIGLSQWTNGLASVDYELL